MRELKYRAWVEVQHFASKKMEMVYFSLQGVFELDQENDSEKMWAVRKHIDSTGKIDEYTGLKDENGKEIYEGDIVCDRNGAQFKANIKMVEVGETIYFMNTLEETGATSNTMMCFYKPIQVIRNIYENP